jgi:hypothetical protein
VRGWLRTRMSVSFIDPASFIRESVRAERVEAQ